MATQAIPISQVVNVLPGVVGAGANPLSLNAIFLSTNPITPATSLFQSSTTDEVIEYYGSGSAEAELAARYVNGFQNSTRKPGTLFFGRYSPTGATSGWVRGRSLAGMTLDQLKSVTGSMEITIDDDVYQTSVPMDFSAVTSFSDAANVISTSLGIGSVATVAWDALFSCFVVTSITQGANSHVSFATGTAADLLGLSSGVQTDGTAQDTPASVMDRVKSQTQDWASFMVTSPVLQDVNEGFAKWCANQNHRYAFIAWDTSAGNEVPNNDATLGALVRANKYEGTFVLYGSSDYAAFICGFIGSINWQELNGRATPAFKTQDGLAPYVSKLSVANAVLSNGANYYGVYQGPGSGNVYNILYSGQMPGSKFKWLDTYVNQIYLNAQLQNAIFYGLTQAKSVPYNSQGETLIRAWCADPIAEALNNGSIRVGVELSNAQKAQINMDAGLDISSQLYGQGYYLQILPATAQVRGQRASPPVKLWYCDGGSIQSINLASIAVL